jgi:hypothetical protein
MFEAQKTSTSNRNPSFVRIWRDGRLGMHEPTEIERLTQQVMDC